MMMLRENLVKVTLHKWHSYGLIVKSRVVANFQPGFKYQENFYIFKYFPMIP